MQYYLTSIFALWALSLSAQKITIDLPHFAGKEYVWFLCKGEKQDTIAHGALDSKGQTVLSVPANDKDWKGMSNFMLSEEGGLDIILYGEDDFSASCAVAQPTIVDIDYAGSVENRFLLEQYIKQQDLLNKAEVISAAMWEYTPDEPFYKMLSDEKTNLEKRFVELQRQTAESPLYAARIREITDFLNGTGSRLDLTEKELIEEQRKYVREVLDFELLWNSSLWKNFFAQWMSFEAAQGDSILLSDSQAILARVQDGDMRETLLEKMIALFQQYGKEALVMQLTEILGSPAKPCV